MIDKKKMFEFLFTENGSAVLIVNAKADGLVLPRFITEGYDFVQVEIGTKPKPIPDLIIDDEGISGTFAFNKRPPFRVKVPWGAVCGIGLEDHVEVRYLESLPPPPEDGPKIIVPGTEGIQ